MGLFHLVWDKTYSWFVSPKPSVDVFSQSFDAIEEVKYSWNLVIFFVCTKGHTNEQKRLKETTQGQSCVT